MALPAFALLFLCRTTQPLCVSRAGSRTRAAGATGGEEGSLAGQARFLGCSHLGEPQEERGGWLVGGGSVECQGLGSEEASTQRGCQARGVGGPAEKRVSWGVPGLGLSILAGEAGSPGA